MELSDTPTAPPDNNVVATPATLAGLLLRQANLQPDRRAFAVLDNNLEISSSLTFGELAAAAEALAQALLQRARPGDRVLLAFHNSPDAIRAFWGCIVAGLIPVPAPAPDSRQSPVARTRLTGMAADADIALALTSPDLVAAADELSGSFQWHSVDSLLTDSVASGSVFPGLQQATDAPAYLQYTSGSTSAPRGVEITHAAVIAQAAALHEAAAVDTERDCSLIWLPWFHDYGLIHALISPVYSGLSSYVMPTLSFMRQPLRWLEAIDKYRITHTGAPNFAFAACVQALAGKSDWKAQLDSLRVASCGAEPVRRETLEAFTRAFAEHGLAADAVAPGYGLAEAVLGVSLARQGLESVLVETEALEQHRIAIAQDADSTGVTGLVSCGVPLPGFDVRIVDPGNCSQRPDDEVGEIWVCGPSTGRGYWGNPSATDATFGARLQNHPEQSFLRTGDLGFLHNGAVFVTGRMKDLLVVHGRNIYPQDLELAAEHAHDAVRPAGVIAVGVIRDDGQEAVVLLAECRGRPDRETVAAVVAAVRRQVAADFELEVHDVVPLRSSSLPRTSSGKPQRAAALRMFRSGDLDTRRLESGEQPVAVEAPEEILREVLAVWSRVLSVAQPEPGDDFFAQGGDSLLATQIVSRLNVQLHIELPVRAVFEAPNPRSLARRVAAALEIGTVTTSQPVPGNTGRGARRQLSFTQERMWFMHQLAPESPAYNVPLALRLRGHIDRVALREAANNVFRRHRILQTDFTATTIGPYALSREGGVALKINEIDLGSAGHEHGDALEATLSRLASEPFRLDIAPLIRVTLIRLADDDAVLLVVMHHIVGDQWSCAVLGRDLAAAYRAQLGGIKTALPDLPLQYADYAEWQRQWLSGERMRQQLNYWREQLDGIQPLQLNEDYPRGMQQSFAGATVRRRLDPERLANLQSLCAAQGVSLSMVLIAALKTLLLRHAGTSDIAIGVPVANRHHLSTEDLIGSFVNTLVFRTDLSGNPSFNETLRRVREVSLEAYAHQDLPFELLVRELDLSPDISRSPLFDVLFNMVNTPATDIEFPGLEWTRLDFDRGAAQFDLTVSVDALYDPAIVFEYATDLYARDTMERLADHYLRIIDAVTVDAGIPVGDLELLGDSEYLRLQQWGEGLIADTEQHLPVSEQVALRAEEAPSARAVICGATERTYEQLDAAANRLAAEIRARGIACGKTVGICLPRSAQLPEVILGALRSGAAYVPLDPAYPRERLRFQAKDAGIDLLIADEQTARFLDWPAAYTLLLDREAGQITGHPDTRLSPDLRQDAGPDDPAYVIYTSGSTGLPKGVVVSHRAITNFLESMRQEPGLDSNDRLLAVTTLGFDIAALELLLPLVTGACTIIADDSQAGDGHLLQALLEKHDITVMQATPSRWQMLIAADWSGKANLRALVGGESLKADLARQLTERCREVWNMYGPTETTVWSSCWRVAHSAIEPISIGKPIAGTTLQVLDDFGQLCPIGVAGELCIGGRGLALGYHNQPALTALQFVTAGEKTAFSGSAIYRTGDRARWRRDGRLEHLGRFDNQLKLRGYRIEPGEIESNLLRHASVAQALISVHEEADALPQLVAYIVVASDSAEATPDEWRAHLRQWLPEHMVPHHFIQLDAIPVLPNGKLDRRALPAPPSASPVHGGADRPDSAPERALLMIWQSVLQRKDFGIHDNFFDLGGHSVLAVTLVQTIVRDLALDCSLPMLFQYPTVASLAEALEHGHGDLRNGAAAQLLAPGDSRPVFFLSGMDLYREVAAQLPADTRAYGLLSAAELALFDSGRPLPSIEELTVAYLQTIRRLQPHGPYRLAGFSIGGVIAFEAASRLRDEGEEIECLALLDSAVPDFTFGHITRWLRKRAAQFRRQGLYFVRRAASELAESAAAGAARTGPAVYPEYARVIRAYKPRQWRGPLVFLQAADDPIRDPGYGWLVHAPELSAVSVPGGHMDMLNEPAARHVAEGLQKQFDNVTTRSLAGAELRYSSSDESLSG